MTPQASPSGDPFEVVTMPLAESLARYPREGGRRFYNDCEIPESGWPRYESWLLTNYPEMEVTHVWPKR